MHANLLMYTLFALRSNNARGRARENRDISGLQHYLPKPTMKLLDEKKTRCNLQRIPEAPAKLQFEILMRRLCLYEVLGALSLYIIREIKEHICFHIQCNLAFIVLW